MATTTDAQPISTVDARGTIRSWRVNAPLRVAASVVLALSCALALSLNVVDPDLWGHVKYGQELLADGRLPTVATHTFTAPDHAWINHETLAEIAMAAGVETIGPYGMLALKCGLGMCILGMMVVVAGWHGVRPLGAWVLMLLVATNLTAFFPLRPQVLSFLLCALMLVALEWAFARWNRREVRFRWLWCVPPLFVIWVNSHGGFVAGLAIFVAYLGGRSIELGVDRWRGRSRSPGAVEQTPDESDGMLLPHPSVATDRLDADRESSAPERRSLLPAASKKLIFHFAAIGTLAVLAIFANPYGVRFPIWLIESLGRPRPEITEWAAPRPGNPVFLPFVLLAIVATSAMLFGRRRRDWTKIAILALVGWQAATHLRHIAFFALLCGFWIPPYFMLLLKRILRRQPMNRREIDIAPWIRPVGVGVLIVVIVVQAFALRARLSYLPVFRDRYPVDAFAFMAKHNVHGRLVVAFNWAQYAIAAFSPEVEVQFDGRFRTCYPQKIVDDHFDFLLGANDGKRYRSADSGPIDGVRALEFGEPDLVLVDRKYEHAVATMRAESERPDASWTLLYQDGVAQLWGRRWRFDRPASAGYLARDQRMISDYLPEGAVEWPALPPRVGGAKVELEIAQATEAEETVTQSRQETRARADGV